MFSAFWFCTMWFSLNWLWTSYVIKARRKSYDKKPFSSCILHSVFEPSSVMNEQTNIESFAFKSFFPPVFMVVKSRYNWLMTNTSIWILHVNMVKNRAPLYTNKLFPHGCETFLHVFPHTCSKLSLWRNDLSCAINSSPVTQVIWHLIFIIIAALSVFVIFINL